MNAQEKIKIVTEGLLKLFPGIDTEFFKYSSLNLGLDKTQEILFNIPNDNKNLINSNYFYRKGFIHFTSFSALNSILQERALRLYNLHNLNDPREFTFASRVLNLDDKIVQDAKDNIFLISFCEKEILKNLTSEFNIWKLYGQNGKGVAIIFSTQNNSSYWRDYHISKVFYGSSNRNVFIKLVDLMDELNIEPPTIYIDFDKIAAFHKSNLYKLEKEVRLIYDCRQLRAGFHANTDHSFGHFIIPNVKSELQKIIDKKDKVHYLSLPIYHKSISHVDPSIPLLKIEKILIGYNFIDEVSSLKTCLEDLCQNNIGYIPEIHQTRLKNYYWDIKKK
jgi:hypothetical protein